MVDADCNRSESALASGSAMLDGGEAPTAATEAPATGAIDLNELLRSGQKLPPSARPPEPAGADGLEQQSWLQQLKMWAVAQSRLEETPMYQIKEQAFSEQLEREAEARRRQVLAQRKEYHRPMDFLQLERQAKLEAEERKWEAAPEPARPKPGAPVRLPPCNSQYHVSKFQLAARESHARRLNAEANKRQEACRRREAAREYATTTAAMRRQPPLRKSASRLQPPAAGKRIDSIISGPPASRRGLYPAVRTYATLSPRRREAPSSQPPSRVAHEQQVKALAARAATLNQRVRDLEAERGEQRRGLENSVISDFLAHETDKWEGALSTQQEVVAGYAQAIRAKLELWEALGQVPSKAHQRGR